MTEKRRVRLAHWLFIVLVLSTLVVALATRFNSAPQENASLHAVSSQTLQQHMNQDAVRWIAPALALGLLLIPTFHPRIASRRPALQTLLLEEKLFNRPPPSL